MPKRTRLMAILAGVTLLSPHAALADHHAVATGQDPVRVAVIDAAGKAIGSVDVEQTPHGVLLSIEASGIAPGEHAVHIHEKGICDAAGGFASAGGHYEPGSHAHGFKIATGPHAGDMPNQFAGEDGKMRAELLNTAVTLGVGVNSLMDSDGSALVIHAGADDYVSQPSGDAGGRIACAVIAPPK